MAATGSSREEQTKLHFGYVVMTRSAVPGKCTSQYLGRQSWIIGVYLQKKSWRVMVLHWLEEGGESWTRGWKPAQR